jgi:hypothetical protein
LATISTRDTARWDLISFFLSFCFPSSIIWQHQARWSRSQVTAVNNVGLNFGSLPSATI